MLTIRAATASDASTILALVRELAAYERDPGAVTATEGDFLRHGFGDRPLFRTLIAEWHGEVAGFALYFFGFSTWTGGPTLSLEDLFVRETHRNNGIGLALMRALAQEAVRESCQRMTWMVLDWNEPSIGFYESLGAKVLHEWKSVRMDRDAVAKLAGEIPA
jgi:GNAT superfamily N-acetyltransferase